eukprot:gene5667-7231_t
MKVSFTTTTVAGTKNSELALKEKLVVQGFEPLQFFVARWLTSPSLIFRWQLSRSSLQFSPSEIHLYTAEDSLAMFTRREKQKPFRPSASFKALDVPLQPFTKSDQVDPDDDHRVRRPPSKPDFPMMVDAETGEPVGYTRAKWTAKEGRLSLTARTILDMGTGKLDIKTRCNPRSDDTLDENSTISQHSNINPIVKEFLQNGPLTPMYPKHRNPVPGTIEDPQEKFALLHAGDLPADNDDASGVRTWTSIDESTIMSSPSAYLYSKPAGRKQEDDVNKSSSVSVAESASPSRNTAGAE